MDGRLRTITKLLLSTLILVLLVITSITRASPPSTQSKHVMLLNIKGAIGPALADYVVTGLQKANKEHTEVVILRMDTPGGLSSSMRSIIKAMLASHVPVISYVSPSGARAASAGTFIAYASQLAVMAPGTNIGAASPVNMMASKGDKKSTHKKSTSETKALNDAKSYIRSLAQLHGRNVDFAERAVSSAESLSAKEALTAHVINYIAHDIQQVLQKADGRVVKVQGQLHTLSTKNLTILHVQPSWHNKLLTELTNPTIAYILMMIGIYGLIFEFSHPGYIMPGVVGAICLLLAVYAFQLLPINYVGLALLILGVGLLIAEAFLPSFGVLGLGGIAAFLFGSLMLFDKGGPLFSIMLSVILAFTVTTGLFVIGIVYLAIQSRRKPAVSGVHTLLGVIGSIEIDHEKLWLHIGGELWTVSCKDSLTNGQSVRVIKVDGSVLHVEPKRTTDQ